MTTVSRAFSLALDLDDTTSVDWVRRPPGCLPHPLLEERCVGCGDCSAVCPIQLITMDEAGYPALSDGDNCVQCGLCADVCSHDVIGLTPRTRAGLAMVHRLEEAL